MRSIKFKLVLAMTVVVVLTMTTTALILKNQKESELNQDLFLNVYTFAENTAGDIVGDYEKSADSELGGSLMTLLQHFVDGQVDIKYVQVASVTKGVVLSTEGDVVAPDMKQVQVSTPSVKTKKSGRVVLVKFVEEAGGGEAISYLDLEGNNVDALGGDERIEYLAFPVGENYTVIYGVSYDSIDQSIAETNRRILLLALLGIFLGVVVSQFLSTRLTAPIRVLKEGAKRIAMGDFKSRVKVKNKDELGILAGSFNQMARDLEKSVDAIRYRERVQRELELAAKIQQDLLPKEIPKVRGLDVAAKIFPADEVGGDCYDFISVGKGRWLFYLGDVTGHGVPSGIVASVANACIYSYAENYDLKKVLMGVNVVLKKKTAANVFLTLVLLKWDERKEVLEYVSAGHEPLVYYDSRKKKVVQLDPGGVPLGMIDKIGDRLDVRELEMKKGDFVVVYSDGIPEARNGKGKLYGMDNFMKSVEKAGVLGSAEEIHAAVVGDVKNYIKGNTQLDDISLIVIRFIG